MSNHYFDYLKAAKIAPIIIETQDTGVTRLVGKGYQYDDHSLWVDARYRGKVIRRANMKAGPLSGRERVVEALNEAAKHYGVTLTAHLVVVARAARLSLELDKVLEDMKANGMLKFFHKEYAKRRKQRQERGFGYMNFATAQRRFRNALIERLIGLRGQINDSGLIDQVLSNRQVN